MVYQTFRTRLFRKRALQTTLRSYNEYAVNVGLKLALPIIKPLDIYILASVGPMITTIETDRLNNGFAFSDILGVGFNYKINTLIFDIRATARHNSNANLSSPNGGVNSLGLETGLKNCVKLTYFLKQAAMVLKCVSKTS